MRFLHGSVYLMTTSRSRCAASDAGDDVRLGTVRALSDANVLSGPVGLGSDDPAEDDTSDVLRALLQAEDFQVCQMYTDFPIPYC